MRLRIGVDVSKIKFDVALLSEAGKYRSRVFSNNLAGFRAFVDWLEENVPGGCAAAHACMEATGVYHEALALHLYDAGVSVSIVNPLKVRRFMEADGLRNKTDAADAKALARYAQKHEPALWQAPTQAVRKLQALVARLDTLQQMRQAELNRSELAHESVCSSINAMVATLDKAIEEVKAQIRSTVDDDPDLKRRSELLQTIPGLGDRTIPQLLAYIGQPERFRTLKALIAYAGLAPLVRQSGTTLNQRRGTHPMGHRELKRCLYFPALVAGRHNPRIACFWDKLKQQHKPGKVIVVACMHKLLAIIYAVLKPGQPFKATSQPSQGA